ncbi:tRNA pseudouridine synthase-like 1 isoform X4 [Elephas maximus indicus]|uniref:tRNA pseudouridine synthase-like 1 isoform X4 n=1 Tax=Elephas maximus indicus TaxID=99487 RepID=UPI002116BF70|nr:tRNA pseudouridine synthase-like 1 isoform X4 [Elephas maximus indicus]
MGSVPAGSVRARYLVYFQYRGTAFNGVAAVRGAQRAVGVQNFLEEAAERLNSVEPVRFTISSRTDAGVHALSNSAHLDVQRRPGQPPFSPEILVEALNGHMRHPAIRYAWQPVYLLRLADFCPLQAGDQERLCVWTELLGGGSGGHSPEVSPGQNGEVLPQCSPLCSTGWCRPSGCPVTSMPATQPHPGPTCIAWPLAAPSQTSCLCLNETCAGLFGLRAWMWPPCRRLPSTSWGHTTSVLSSQLAAQPGAQCAHCGAPPCPLGMLAPLSVPRRTGAENDSGIGGCGAGDADACPGEGDP